jgi:membrane associated rhomboid family serine protease
MFDKLKALVAAGVGFVATWVMAKFGFDLSVEIQAAIIAAVMGVIVWIVPNIKAETPAA